MSDTCPKCGAVIDSYHAHEPDDEACLELQLTDTQADKIILLGEFNRLIGYAATCKADNTVDWMIGLEFRLNMALHAVDDHQRVKLTHDGDCYQFTQVEVGDE